MKYYCLHHPPLQERREYLVNKFNLLNLDVEWVTNFLPDEITIPVNSFFKCKGEYSLYLKHLYCFEEQVKNSYEYITIFEDDVLLDDDFNQFFNDCMNEFKDSDGGILFTGICCNIRPTNIIPGKKIYWEPNNKTRCTHCYTVPLKTSHILLKHFYSEYEAVDFKLNKIIEIEKIKSYHSEPGIYQGSHRLIYKGTLNIN